MEHLQAAGRRVRDLRPEPERLRQVEDLRGVNRRHCVHGAAEGVDLLARVADQHFGLALTQQNIGHGRRQVLIQIQTNSFLISCEFYNRKMDEKFSIRS